MKHLFLLLMYLKNVFIFQSISFNSFHTHLNRLGRLVSVTLLGYSATESLDREVERHRQRERGRDVLLNGFSSYA